MRRLFLVIQIGLFIIHIQRKMTTNGSENMVTINVTESKNQQIKKLIGDV